MRTPTHIIVLLLALAGGFSGAPLPGAPGNVYLDDPSAGAPVTVQLERLDAAGTALSGRYVRVTSHRLGESDAPMEGIGGGADFRYEPNTKPLADCTWEIDDCSPFDAVNVYFHIDRFAHEFWSMRMGVEIPFQATAVIHFPGEGATSIADSRTIRFTLGNTMMKNAALDPDIIHHEYTHLITSALGFEVDIESSVEMRAINEAVAHYFAASFADDPRIGEWVVTCPPRLHCTGPANDDEMATLSTDPAVWNWNDGRPSDQLKYGACTRYYPLDGKCKIGYHNFTDVYTWGMIWGSALWDVREEIGPAAADRLVLESITAAPGNDVDFDDALRALIAADARLFGGVHSRTIADVFSARGFDVAGLVHTEVPPPAVRAFDLRLVGANPAGAGTIHLTFHLGNPAPARLAIYDPVGRRVALLYDGAAPAGTHAATWSPDSVPSGRYLAVLTSGSMRRSLLVTIVK